MTAIDSTLELRDGHRIPQLGLGVFQLTDENACVQAVKAALAMGYRHIDTAAVYRNEEAVGKGLRASDVPREEIHITTKLWISDFDPDKARAACEGSLKRLGLDYVDLYLIHWPMDDTMMPAWETMQALRDEGKCRSIGVSNFSVRRLEEAFLPHTDEIPVVNQVEWHPFCYDAALEAYCREKGILLEGWGPVTRGQKLDHPVVAGIAEEAGRTGAQVLLRWQLQHGVITIPKSSHPERIRENCELYDFALSEDQVSRLDGLTEGLSLSSWRPCPPEDWY